MRYFIRIVGLTRFVSVTSARTLLTLTGVLGACLGGHAWAAGRGGGRPAGRDDFPGGQHSYSQPPSQNNSGRGVDAKGLPDRYQRPSEPWRPADKNLAGTSNSLGGDRSSINRAEASINRLPGSNPSWYHGSWHGNWTPAWGQTPAGWAYAGNAYGRGPYSGLGRAATIGNHGTGAGTGVGAGAVAAVVATSSPWAFGYWGYTNPFYASGLGWGQYNYSQPLALAAPTGAANSAAPAVDPNVVDPNAVDPNAKGPLDGSQAPDVADVDPPRDAFKRGDYKTALELTDQELMQQPGDPILHQFRALCEFAVGHYQQSAAGVYSVLATGPGWDWTTLIGLYPSVDVYTEQLRALEAYSRANPEAADARFLMAYHYLIQGYDGAAETEFREVARLQPNNVVAAQLFKTLTNPSATTPDMTGPAPSGPGQTRTAAGTSAARGPAGKGGAGANGANQSTAPIDAGALVGHWSATTPDGGKFVLDLDKNQAFVWKFGQTEKMSTIEGKYTLSGNLLVLEGANQQNLAGQVKLEAANRLSFRLPGGGGNDPGLTFVR